MTEAAPAEPRAKPLLARLAPAALIAAALAAFFAFDLNRYFDLETFRQNREALQAWVDANPALSIGAFIALYTGLVAISFPGASIMTIAGGYLFGLAKGAAAVVVAATLGACIVFLAAKYAFGDFFAARAGGFAKRMEEGFKKDELNYMFVLRLMPVFPFWAVNIGAGLVGVSFRNFFIGTLLGIVPGSFVYASIGAAAVAAFDAGEELSLSGVFLKPAVLLPVVGLSLLALAPVVYRRFFRTRTA